MCKWRTLHLGRDDRGKGELRSPLPSLVVSRSELEIGTSLQVRMAQQGLNVTRLCGVGPPHTTTVYWVTNSIHMRVYRFHARDIPTGDMSHLRGAAPHRRCQARPNGLPLWVVFLVGRHSCDVVAAHYVEMRHSQRGTH